MTSQYLFFTYIVVTALEAHEFLLLTNWHGYWRLTRWNVKQSRRYMSHGSFFYEPFRLWAANTFSPGDGRSSQGFTRLVQFPVFMLGWESDVAMVGSTGSALEQ